MWSHPELGQVRSSSTDLSHDVHAPSRRNLRQETLKYSFASPTATGGVAKNDIVLKTSASSGTDLVGSDGLNENKDL